jgi:hypothetical protein
VAQAASGLCDASIDWPLHPRQPRLPVLVWQVLGSHVESHQNGAWYAGVVGYPGSRSRSIVPRLFLRDKYSRDVFSGSNLLQISKLA